MSHTKTLNDLTNYIVAEYGCWEWQGNLDSKGYGQMRMCGPKRLAHRLSWTKHKGPIPEGMDVLHSCDNRPCINPEHLFLGNAKLNAEDRQAKGRGGDFTGSSNGRALLIESEVIKIRQDLQSGRTCAELAREYKVTWATIKSIKVGETWRHASAQPLQL